MKLGADMEEVMIVCALRFEGWRYVEEHRKDLECLTREVIAGMKPLPEISDNFALFFSLQRFFGKWGGESTLATRSGHKVFRLLFKSLLQEPTPRDYINWEYEQRWQQEFLPRLEIHAEPVLRACRRLERLERDIQGAGASLTPAGSLLLLEGYGWPEPGSWCFRADPYKDCKPVIYPAAEAADPDERMGKWRELTKREKAVLKTEPRLAPVRRYCAYFRKPFWLGSPL